eukprot:TRINITY_DN2989_c0_g1_i5.p1 TRINITY_DN2989_c0_g1~~TRINITY_DN2989_c0_g1_i5.p1  ORF type:complete len:596 (-),score=148.30 TRINITY_DN2989_c0_g1_i5:20-1780(-)
MLTSVLLSLYQLVDEYKLLSPCVYNSNALVEVVSDVKKNNEEVAKFSQLFYDLVRDIQDDHIQGVVSVFNDSRVAMDKYIQDVNGVYPEGELNEDNVLAAYELVSGFPDFVINQLGEHSQSFSDVDMNDQIDMAKKLTLKGVWVHALLSHQIAMVRNSIANICGDEIDEHLFPPVPGVNRVSTKWMTSTLQSNGVISSDETVTKIEMLGMDNRILAGPGAMNRLSITYKGTENESTLTYVLKLSFPNLANIRSNILGTYREGIFFNSELMESMPYMPLVLYSYGSSLLGEYAILMEDLSSRNGVATNKVFGNQCWGPVEIEPPRDPVEVLKKIFLEASFTHAKHWNDKSLLDVTWLRAVGWYQGYNRATWELSMAKAKSDWEFARDKFEIDPKFAEIIDKAFAATSWDALQAHFNKEDHVMTLCHGDFHGGNTFLVNDGDGDKVIMFDMSEIGVWEPLQDIPQTLMSDVKPEIFKEHGEELLRMYWENLIKLGVPESYTWERCKSDFARGAERWIYMFCICANMGIPQFAIDYFQNQILSFIEAFPIEEDAYVLKTVVAAKIQIALSQLKPPYSSDGLISRLLLKG